MSAISALRLVHDVLKAHIPTGGVCVDATAGRGNDTLFLCRAVGPTGKVYAFDIQPEAVACTRAKLETEGIDNAQVMCESHAHMARRVNANSVDCVVFNLGYLPRGDHRVYTHFESTRAAIEAGLDCLKEGGLMCVTIYYGGDSGYEEKEALLPYLAGLDDQRYQVLVTQFHNWRNDPPIPVFIRKLR